MQNLRGRLIETSVDGDIISSVEYGPAIATHERTDKTKQNNNTTTNKLRSFIQFA